MLQLLKDVDKLSNNAPIGVFDSGLGGLTVWREVRRALPAESLVYLGDGKNCPYGSRPREEVRRLADEAVAFLVAQGCKLVVVACNTAHLSMLAVWNWILLLALAVVCYRTQGSLLILSLPEL